MFPSLQFGRLCRPGNIYLAWLTYILLIGGEVGLGGVATWSLWPKDWEWAVLRRLRPCPPAPLSVAGAETHWHQVQLFPAGFGSRGPGWRLEKERKKPGLSSPRPPRSSRALSPPERSFGRVTHHALPLSLQPRNGGNFLLVLIAQGLPRPLLAPHRWNQSRIFFSFCFQY